VVVQLQVTQVYNAVCIDCTHIKPVGGDDGSSGRERAHELCGSCTAHGKQRAHSVMSDAHAQCVTQARRQCSHVQRRIVSVIDELLAWEVLDSQRISREQTRMFFESSGLEVRSTQK
jgi:hypothetical protein